MATSFLSSLSLSWAIVMVVPKDHILSVFCLYGMIGTESPTPNVPRTDNRTHFPDLIVLLTHQVGLRGSRVLRYGES